jgi:hypothetical protein
MDLWKPSRQARGIVVYDELDPGLRQQRPTPYGLFGLHQLWNPRAPADTRIVKLCDKPVTLGRSATGRLTPNANDVAARLAYDAAAARVKSIVFVQQAGHAPSTASKVARWHDALTALPEKEQALWNDIVAECGGAEHSLVNRAHAALPHNGDMVALERRLVESMFRRPDGARCIVATPTLAQGMNLPAQLAIIAGDKRHDEKIGRDPLKAHEILNAAGRAGRAGHLANGVVLLIPEPVTTVRSDAKRLAPLSTSKLASILPQDDHCVELTDPITGLLDKIQVGSDGAEIRYFVSRMRSFGTTDDGVKKAQAFLKRSFGAFHAESGSAEEAFNKKLDVLKERLTAPPPGTAAVCEIAAAMGFPEQPFSDLESAIASAWPKLPETIAEWCDWTFDFLASEPTRLEACFGPDAGTLTYIVRGKKTGGPLTKKEYETIKSGVRAWISGKPLREIELALGVDKKKLRACPRARDLALKIAPRPLYLLLAAVSEIVPLALASGGHMYPQPAVLETLAVSSRKGLDTPDKAAFALKRTGIRSRVLIHTAFAKEIGHPMKLAGQDFAAVRDALQLRLLGGLFGSALS